MTNHAGKRVAVLYRTFARTHLCAIAERIFAALAGVRLAADPIHRDRKRRMRFGRDGAETHRARREPLDDFLRRLNVVDRYGHALARLEFEQPAQRLELL